MAPPKTIAMIPETVNVWEWVRRSNSSPGPKPILNFEQFWNDALLIRLFATVLAAELGQERMQFKGRVRQLKGLGLTISLGVGYRLSPRGLAYLDSGG